MKKREKTLIIAAAVVLVLALVLWLVLPGVLKKDDGGDTTPTTTTTTAVPDIVVLETKEEVVSLRVTNALDTYTIVSLDNGTMAVEDYSDLPADSTAITACCNVMKKLTALSAVQAVEGEAAYGFDTPSATVTATYRDGSTETVVFGAVSAGTDGYYCRRTGDNTLYIVDSATVARFATHGKQLIAKTLIAPPSVAEDDKNGKAQLMQLWLTGRCRDQAVEIVTDTEAAYPDLTYVSTYIITSPYLRSVDSDNFHVMAAQMTSLTAASVEMPHPTQEQMKAYGLADPYSIGAFTLAVAVPTIADNGNTVYSQYNTREHMVMLGDKNEDGLYYALINGYDVVYLVTPSSVPWAELTYHDVTNKLLFMKDITTVDEMTITENGTAMTFALTHNAEESDADKKMTVTSGGKIYSTPEFRILYQLMIGIHRVAEPEDGATPSGTPVLTFDMTFNDGTKPMSLSLYTMSANRYLCVTDDGEYTAVSIRDAEDFLRQYHNYQTGAPVVSPY